MTAVTTASPATRTGPAPTWGGGRIALIVVGAILGLLGISILVGGVAVAVGLLVGGGVLFLVGLGLVIGAVVSYGRQPKMRPQPRITVSQPDA